MNTRRQTFTPRQAAYTVAIDWLRAAHGERTGDIHQLTRDEPSPTRYGKQIKLQIAKLHNRLLSESGLEGLGLPEDEEV